MYFESPSFKFFSKTKPLSVEKIGKTRLILSERPDGWSLNSYWVYCKENLGLIKEPAVSIGNSTEGLVLKRCPVGRIPLSLR